MGSCVFSVFCPELQAEEGGFANWTTTFVGAVGGEVCEKTRGADDMAASKVRRICW